MKNNWSLSILLLIGCLLYIPEAIAQNRTCGMVKHQTLLEQDPVYLNNYRSRLQLYEKVTQARARQGQALCTTPIVLPVAIHFQNITNPDTACLRVLSQAQIDILNADFQAKNADTTEWLNNASSFPGIQIGSTCVQFVLANKNHPTGYQLQDGDPAVTINVTSGDFISGWKDYINVVVRDIGDLGYAPFGGLGNGDVITVDDNAFGSSSCGQVFPQYPYNLGRTLVHEVGHYLYLNHIWANDFDMGGCENDDGVSDTPVSAAPHYGCPSLSSSCGSTDLQMNYMDYVNDACMYLFTAGQAQRMDNWIAANLQHVIQKAATAYEGSCTNCTPSNCTDVDGDGYCVDEDCDDNNSAIPAASGTACNDNNATTYNDRIQADGCTCQGIVDPCFSQGGDTDGDGVCDDVDCDPSNACYPKAVGTACNDGLASTVNDRIGLDGCSCTGTAIVQAKLLLEGLYNPDTREMTTELNAQTLLPLFQPYNVSPWFYAGTESVNLLPSDVVDWVLIMLRDANNTILSRAAGFITSDGTLRDIQGNPGIFMANAQGHYISIHPRNHLAIISNQVYTEAIDFTSSTTSVQGIEQVKNISGTYCLYAGDYDGNGIINNMDYNAWVSKKSLLNQYLPVDGDGNGIVNNLDYNLWSRNRSKISQNSLQY